MPIMSLALSSGVVILTAVILASASAAVAGAGRKPARATAQAPTQSPAKRDCTPINGRYGYYGNPWCDTGSYRQEDIEFRERNATRRRVNGYSSR